MAGIIGENLKRLRMAAGMSQEKLGEVMDVHQSVISYWECVYSWSPTGEDMLRLCELFGVEVGEFYRENREGEIDNATT